MERSGVVVPRAAEFITDWSRLSKYCGIPEKVALPWSSRDRTSDTASDWNMDLETDRRTVRSCRNTAKQPETVFVTYVTSMKHQRQCKYRDRGRQWLA